MISNRGAAEKLGCRELVPLIKAIPIWPSMSTTKHIHNLERMPQTKKVGETLGEDGPSTGRWEPLIVMLLKIKRDSEDIMP